MLPAVPSMSARVLVALAASARMLAKHGVNCVRVLSSVFDQNGEVDQAKVQQMIDLVETHKAEGIYTIFSIYWFNMITPKADDPILPGYDEHGALPEVRRLVDFIRASERGVVSRDRE